MNYDLIGDIHGHSEPLVELLEKLGYQKTNKVFRHPKRQVIFLGDFIDRGPNQREVIEIVRPMIEQKAALSVMGNHEFNAIAFATPDPDNPGEYLREQSEKNQGQHRAFLNAYDNASDYEELIEWFRHLPLWLERDGLRVVHACWDEKLICYLSEHYAGVNTYFDDRVLVAASRPDSEEFRAVETLLKGKEIRMPRDQYFLDKDGRKRHEIRVKWWGAEATTLRSAFLGPDSAVSHIPEDPIDVEHLLEYGSEEPPVFVGHYWLDTDPALLAPNVACLDYSVAAQHGGKLVAYRWDGEQKLNSKKFDWVLRDPC